MTVDERPVVSVVIAAHDAESTVGRAIESVLAQTWSRLEVVVVDDCSTDATAETVRCVEDDRVRLLRLDENRGPAGARNAGFDASNGTWIAVLDADDWWEPRRLETLMGVADEVGRQVIADDVHLWLETGETCVSVGTMFEENDVEIEGRYRTSSIRGLVENELDIKPIFPANLVGTGGVEQWEESFGAEWLPFLYELVSEGCDIVLVDEAMYNYRFGQNSLARTLGLVRREIRVTEQLLRDVDPDGPLADALSERLKFMQYRTPWVAVREGKPVVALAALLKTPGSLPWFLRRKVPALLRRWIRRFTGSGSDV